MTNDSNPPRTSRPRTLPLGGAVLLVVLGAVLGSALTGAFRDPAPIFPAGLFAAEGAEEAVSGDYKFFTFRRNLWAINRTTGKVQFLMFPDGTDQTLQRSAIHQVDQELFPPDQVEYQLSERNLTNFLWILNPTTGKARYIRAARDGGFEFSEIYTVTRLGQ